MRFTRFPRRTLLAVAVMAVAAASVAPAARAADVFPSKPITLVVPFPPGGSNDVMGRIIAKRLGDALGQSIVIDNRGGAGGNLGASSVARAAPDGYTLLIVSSTFASNAAIQPAIPYDAVKSFAPVGLLARGPLIVAVNNDFPARNPKELVEAFRANPGKFNYASGGPGSLNNFSSELLKLEAHLDITHVPYKGGGPALTDLMSNRVQMFIASAPALLPIVRSGKLRAVAITSLKASPVAPELQPLSSAVPGFHYETWWGLLAPAGTPAPIVAKLNNTLNDLLRSPGLRDDFLREGAEPEPATPAAFGTLIAAEVERMRKLAKQQGIVSD